MMLLVVDPRPVRSIQDQCKVPLARSHEPRMEKGELLVQELRSPLSVMFECRGRWSEALQHRFGGDLGDVVEHLAVFSDRFKLLRLDGQDGVALDAHVRARAHRSAQRVVSAASDLASETNRRN